jgi:hypothetical protein
MRKFWYWIDNNINHTIVEGFFGLFPLRIDDKFDLVYWIWDHTSRAFCYWVNGIK